MSRDYKSRNSSRSANEKGGSAFFGGFVGYALGLMSAIGIWLYLNYAPSPFLSNEKVASSSEKSEARPAPEQPKTPVKPVDEEPLSAIEERPRFDFYKILPGIDEPEPEQAEERPVQPPAPARIPENINKPVEIARQPPALTYPSISPAETVQQSTAIQSRSIPPEPIQQPVIPQAPQIQSPPPAKEKFFLQTGSFRKNDEAENMKARLALLGVLSSIQPIDLAEKGVWYRVRVGPFVKKEDVDETSASLKENGIAAQFIKTP